MKHLQKWNKINESSSLELEDIVNVLQDVIDEGYEVVIFSMQGYAFYPRDVNDDSAQYYKTELDGKKRVKFRIDISHKFDFHFLLKFMQVMKPVVDNFEEWGFKLNKFADVAANKEYMSYDFLFIGDETNS